MTYTSILYLLREATRLLKVLTYPILLVLLYSPSYASTDCPSHTAEQEALIHRAYYTGLPYDLGYTLAAIVWQESFVWKYIVKVNPSDGEHGSYGVSHVTLEYAMEQEGYTSEWKAKQDLVPMLINNDQYSLAMSIKKLLEYGHRPWRGMVKKYNGTGAMAEKYADSITEKVKSLRHCYEF